VGALEVEDKRIVAVRDPPFRVAVTVAVWSVESVPATAAKVALALPGSTVTAGGTLRAGALVASAMAVPPVPAAFDSVTVQVERAPVLSVVDSQERPLTVTDVTNEIVVVRETPSSEAVRVAA
jgi:hypothetical protein